MIGISLVESVQKKEERLNTAPFSLHTLLHLRYYFQVGNPIIISPSSATW